MNPLKDFWSKVFLFTWKHDSATMWFWIVVWAFVVIPVNGIRMGLLVLTTVGMMMVALITGMKMQKEETDKGWEHIWDCPIASCGMTLCTNDRDVMTKISNAHYETHFKEVDK